MTQRTLRSDRRGAAMVFGLFFALFLIAAVWSVMGIAQAILYRDKMQDAADAAAFAAAVVNARGMNLIALINMVMAAILSILVGIRIAETLCLVAIAICAALSFVSFGATSSFMPFLTNAALKLHRAFEQAKPKVQQALSLLHTGGKAVSVVVPLGANARVIDLAVADYGVLAVAIPARVKLPVEDDDFTVLCEHAGRFAGHVAMLPFKLIFSGPFADDITSKLSNAVGALAAAGSSWFCGGGSPPKLKAPDEQDGPPMERLPRFPSEEACAQSLAAPDDSPLGQQRKPICDISAFERLASIPDREGNYRQGQRVCPVDCKDSTSVHCPPKSFADCDAARAAELDQIALENQPQTGANFPSSTLQFYQHSPYVMGMRLAVEQCKPKSLGGSGALLAFQWLEQKMTRTYRYDGTAWMEVPGDRRSQSMVYVQRAASDEAYPCGPKGIVDDGYDATLSPKFVCEGNPVCEDTLVPEGGRAAPCDRSPPKGAHPGVFRETMTQVIAIIGCGRRLPPGKEEQVPPVDLKKEMAGSGKNLNPFRLQSDLMLGGSDFQLRAVSLDHQGKKGGPPDTAVGLVRLPAFSPADSGSVANNLAELGRFAFAQAEYYFDWTGLTGASDRAEWMWHMGWRARMRPFRLRHSKADAPRKKDAVAMDAEQEAFTAPPFDKPVEKLDEPCPRGVAGACKAAEGALKTIAPWEEP